MQDNRTDLARVAYSTTFFCQHTGRPSTVLTTAGTAPSRRRHRAGLGGTTWKTFCGVPSTTACWSHSAMGIALGAVHVVVGVRDVIDECTDGPRPCGEPHWVRTRREPQVAEKWVSGDWLRHASESWPRSTALDVWFKYPHRLE